MSQSVDAGMLLSPTYHYELAVSLSAKGNVDTKDDAIFEAAIAVALSRDPTSRCPCSMLYSSLSGKDWRSIFLIRTANDLEEVMLLQLGLPAPKTFVLLPGDYQLHSLQFTAVVTLLAAAPDVIIRSRGAHVLFTHPHADVTVRDISFQCARQIPRAQLACICVAEDSSLVLTNCEIPEWPGEAGILVHGGSCRLNRCRISRTGKQGIEVRQGGSLTVCGSQITNCFQGIVAYGGARSVSIVGCNIRGMVREGILGAGSHYNEPTAAQEFLNHRKDKTTIEAVTWGKSHRVDLDLIVRNTIVESIGDFGVSIDYGCRATIHNCKIRDCKSYCIFIKGESPVLIADSVFTHGKGEGIHVGANYAAQVQLINNSFVGKSIDKAVVDEFNGGDVRVTGHQAMLAMKMGMWSYPVKQELSRNFATELERSNAMCGNELSGNSSLEIDRSVKLTSCRPLVSPTAKTVSVDMIRISRVTAPLDTLPLYYAIGNTHGFDVTDGCTWADFSPCHTDATQMPVFNILLAACGDIRNILKTVHSASSNSSSNLHFLLNDISVSILARDILLLSLIEQEAVSAEDVISVWASHGLTRRQRQLVDKSCQLLSEGHWPSFLLLPVADHSNLEDSLRECFRHWRNSTVTLESILRFRQSLVGFGHNQSLALTLRALNNGRPCSKRQEKEISDYLTSGSLHWGKNGGSQLSIANPTLLEAPHMQYHLYWSSSIFRAVRLCDLDGHQSDAVSQTYTQRLLTTLEPQIGSVRRAMRQGSIKCSLMLGDIVNCATDLSVETWKQPNTLDSDSKAVCWGMSKFHFIDVSNVSDYVSLPVALQICSRFLHQSHSAIIHAQSTHWPGKANAYFLASFGMKRSVYSRILGLILTNIQIPLPKHVQMMWRWGPRKEPRISQNQLVDHLTSASKIVCRPRAYTYAGLNSSAALSIAHLTFCAADSPSEAKSLIQIIASSSSEARKYKWQLTLVGKLQSEDADQICAEFVIASFVADIDLFQLLMHKLASKHMLHLVLVVTSAPLTRGGFLTADKVLQFIDAFAFEPQSHRVQLMLTKTLISRIASRSYSITLCGCHDESGQTVTILSNSVLMNDLDISNWQQEEHNILVLPSLWS